MKKAILSFFGLLFLPFAAFANPACIVCTVAIGASLEISRRLGISDNVVALWAGAMLAILGYWAITWFEKKNWQFPGRDFLLVATSVAMIGFVYLGMLPYMPKIIGFLYIDPFLLSALAGAVIFVCSQKFYQWMKRKNGGHAHFPFEKVVLPLVLLGVASAYVNYYPL